MPAEPPESADPLDPAGLVGRAAETAAVRRMLDGSAAFIEPYAAPPLGLLDLTDGWYRASMIPVGDGDQLLLYTDGVSEARDESGRFFPLAQVTADMVRDAGPDRAPLLDVLVSRLDEHVGGRGCDDILVLLVTMR
jgi:serine phosphatase RsbU (regulator of sigma subunit)